MQVTAFSTTAAPDWRWRIVNYAGELVEESHETFPTIAGALEHVDIGDETLSLREKPLKNLLRVPLVGVGRPHQIHRNVRIEEDHRGGAS